VQERAYAEWRRFGTVGGGIGVNREKIGFGPESTDVRSNWFTGGVSSAERVVV